MSGSGAFVLVLVAAFVVGIILSHLMWGGTDAAEPGYRVQDRAREAQRHLDQVTHLAQQELYRQVGRAQVQRITSQRLDRQP